MIYSVHGFTGCPLFFGDLPTQGLSVLGHSSDAIATAPVPFDDEVDRLASKLPDAPVHLVGYSMGARLCLALALRHPSRVSELSLISPCPGLMTHAEREERCQSDQAWIRLLRDEGIEAFVDAWEELPMWHSQRALPAERIAQQRSERLAHSANQLAFALESLGTGVMPNLAPQLGGLELPVRILAGALDAKFCELGLQMASLLPRSELFIIKDCGHNPVLEKPDDVARRLMEPIS